MMNVTYIFLIVLLLILFTALAVLNWKRQLLREERTRRLLQIGKQGEEETIRQLERIRGVKHIFHNVYVPLKDKKNTTEIDMVMVHEKGIFVIENKNYSGRIYGDEEEARWRQVQKKNGRKWERTFYNPVWQNRTHIRNLKRFLEQELSWDMPFVSVIVFNDRAKLRRIRIYSGEPLVSESRKVRRKLKRKLRWSPKVFSRKQMECISEILRPLENPGKRVAKQHGKYLARKKTQMIRKEKL